MEDLYGLILILNAVFLTWILFFNYANRLYFCVSNMRQFIKLLPILFLCAISSCTEENDCIGCNLNPRVKIKFETAFLRAETEQRFTQVKSTINILRDSLLKELPQNTKDIILAELAILKEDSLRLGYDFELFRTNKIQIDEISAPGSVSMEMFQDTVVFNFAMPVDMMRDTTTFYFSYHGFVDTLQIHYERSVIQNLQGVRMRLKNIGVNMETTTFDSLRVQCNRRECSNDQTTIYIYP